jgi:hypothetical protein
LAGQRTTSLGLDQDQMLLPVGVEAPDQQPEKPVSGLEVRARMGTERDMELVPQKQVLDHEVAPVSKEPGQRPEKAD